MTLLEIEAEQDDAVRVNKLFKLAELLEQRLERATDAVAALRQLIEIKPDFQPARKFLERLFQKMIR